MIETNEKLTKDIKDLEKVRDNLKKEIETMRNEYEDEINKMKNDIKQYISDNNKDINWRYWNFNSIISKFSQ